MKREGTKLFADLGGRDRLVNKSLKLAESDGGEVRERPGRRRVRKVTVRADDPGAADYVARNRDLIRRVVSRLNSQGVV